MIKKVISKCAFICLILMMFCISDVNAEGNRYIIKLKDEHQLNSLSVNDLKLMENINDTKQIGDNTLNLYSTSDGELIQKLKDDCQIEYVEDDLKMRLFDTITTDHRADQWYLSKTNAIKARDGIIVSSNVKIAVIDSGIQAHPDIKNVTTGKNYIQGSTDPTDTSDELGHGTIVAGIIGATWDNVGVDGIAYGVTLVPFKCFSNDGTARVADIISAISDAVNSGCKIINISAGVPQNSSSLSDAIRFAEANGVIVVAAVGNDGNDVLNYPASYSTVVGVGSVNSSYLVSSFSQKNNSVMVCAPGENIWSTNAYNIPAYYGKYYKSSNGTSFSTPQITGFAGLVCSKKPNITPNEFRNLIKTVSVDYGDTGYDTSYGYGIIDMYAGVKFYDNTHNYYLSPLGITGNNVSQKISNFTNQDTMLTNILSTYAQTGELIDVKIQPITLPKNNITWIQTPINSAWSTTKSILINGFDAIKPMAESVYKNR